MIDLVAIGHVTFDETPSGIQPGGSAYYAALTAHRLGLGVGLLTAAAADYPLDIFPEGIDVHVVPSPQTTSYRVGESKGARTLTLLSRRRSGGGAASRGLEQGAARPARSGGQRSGSCPGERFRRCFRGCAAAGLDAEARGGRPHEPTALGGRGSRAAPRPAPRAERGRPRRLGGDGGALAA